MMKSEVNKTRRVAAFVISALALLLANAGCTAPDARVRAFVPDSTLITCRFEGQSRLFSRVGFLALDPALRKRISEVFDSEGKIDPSKLSGLGTDWTTRKWDDGVELVYRQNRFRNIVLRPGYLIALDPEFDEIIKSMAAIGSHRRVVPNVPITIGG